MKPAMLSLCAAALLVSAAPAQTPDTRINPTIQQIVDAISQERMAATLRKLESFGSRNVNLPPDDPALGIGAAERWIHDEFESYNPRLEVSYQDFMVKKDARPDRLLRDVYLSNVVAVLPGVTERDRLILVTAHYDSVNIVRKPYTGEEQMIAEMVRLGFDEADARTYRKLVPPDVESGPPDLEATTAAAIAPGVTDDGSGTAVVMELARVMSQHQFDKTLVFIAFSAEEIGEGGSQAWAEMAKQKGMQIEAVLNNDIVGSDVSRNGRSATHVLRVFSGADESPTRELGRYVKRTGERYVPSMQLEMIFRRDRFLRGGDHTPFAERGFAAVRLTTASENYANQHSATDTFANTSVPYTARVAKINGAVAASLALAPAPPVLNWTWNSGPRKGGHEPMLTRGKSRYDAVLHWLPSKEADLAGYNVLLRATTSPDWERVVWVGNVNGYTMPDVSIDDVVIGVQAVDKEGNASIVSPYLEPTRGPLVTPVTK